MWYRAVNTVTRSKSLQVYNHGQVQDDENLKQFYSHCQRIHIDLSLMPGDHDHWWSWSSAISDLILFGFIKVYIQPLELSVLAESSQYLSKSIFIFSNLLLTLIFRHSLPQHFFHVHVYSPKHFCFYFCSSVAYIQRFFSANFFKLLLEWQSDITSLP